MKKFNSKAWWDRNYNLLFHRSECIRISFLGNYYAYGDVMFNGMIVCRYLGKGWFKGIDVTSVR